MKTIPLTQGYVAVVDDEDYEDLAQHRWCVSRSGRMLYAARSVGGRKSPQKVYMHVVIARPGPGLLVDHKDRDGLNNRRGNLRVGTKKDNEGNSGPRAGSSSRFKGVHRHSQNRVWVAQLRGQGIRANLGSWDTEELAALAYDRAARDYYGDFAYLNFPDVSDYSVLDVSKVDHRRNPKGPGP